MGFSRVAVTPEEAAVLSKKLLIEFSVPRRVDDFFDPLVALTRVVEAVAEFQETQDAAKLKAQVLDAVASTTSLASELQTATLKLLKAPDVRGLGQSGDARPKQTESGGSFWGSGLWPRARSEEVVKPRTNQSVFVVVWAAKRIQRAFRSYGKRRDRKTIANLLGI